MRSFAEYVGGFINPDSVRKIQEARRSTENYNFADDKDFEKQVLNKEYQENPYVDAIIKLRQSKNANNSSIDSGKPMDIKSRVPKDLKFLKDL